MEKDYKHILFMQKAKKGKIEEYRETHKKAWPKLLKAIKESGIEREIIWIHGDYVYIYMMTRDFDGSMKKLGEKEIFKDWIVKMDNLLDEMQDYSGDGNIVTLEKVFNLEHQLDAL